MDNNNKKMVRKRIRFATKKTTPLSVLSLIIGILSIVLLICMFILSAVNKGLGGFVTGSLPIVGMLCNIMALIVAYRQLKIENIRVGIVSAAAVINGLMIVIYLIIYLAGFYLMFNS